MRDTDTMPAYAPSSPPQDQFTPRSWMRAIRTAHRYTAADMARFMGVRPKQVMRWERRDRLPRKAKYRRIWNTYARGADLPELAFQFAPVEDE